MRTGCDSALYYAHRAPRTARTTRTPSIVLVALSLVCTAGSVGAVRGTWHRYGAKRWAKLTRDEGWKELGWCCVYCRQGGEVTTLWESSLQGDPPPDACFDDGETQLADWAWQPVCILARA